MTSQAESCYLPATPRRARVTPRGLVYHVLNRSVAGLPLFRKPADYEAFERNALTARLVRRAEEWRWGSLWARRHGDEQLQAMLSDWPVARPRDWVGMVNAPLTEKEAEGIRTSVARNRPYGCEEWQTKQAKRLGLLHTMRSEGRPKACKPAP